MSTVGEQLVHVLLVVHGAPLPPGARGYVKRRVVLPLAIQS